MQDVKPFLKSVVVTIVFALAYFIVRFLNLPFEKVIFIIIPLPLNLLPAFALAVYGRRQSPVPIIISLIFYSIFSIIGLLQPANQFFTTLLAALCPIVVAFFAVIFSAAELPDLINENEKELPNDGR